MENYVIPGIYDLDMTDHAKGNRYYCLAHFYLQYMHYREFFKKVKAAGGFITLDNSAAEKALVTEEKLLGIVDDLQPNEVIPPDVLFDKQATLDNFYPFIEKMKVGARKNVGIFACPQGTNGQQWFDCYAEMKKHPRVTVLGLSKIAVPKCFAVIDVDDQDQNIKEGRHNCIDYLYASGSITKPLHFLGMGDPTEYLYYRKPKFESVRRYFRSTDSCYSILAAVHGIDFEFQYNDNGIVERVRTTDEFYEHKLDSFERQLALRNIAFLNNIIGD